MADVVDTANDSRDFLNSLAIRNSKSLSSHRKGEQDCLKCGEPNDRSDEGYGVCSECVK